MRRVGRSVVSATTHTPASGPFGPVTTPPMSSPSTDTGRGACALPTPPRIAARISATPTAASCRCNTLRVIGRLRQMRPPFADGFGEIRRGRPHYTAPAVPREGRSLHAQTLSGQAQDLAPGVTFEASDYRPLYLNGHVQTVYAWAKPRTFPRLPAPVPRFFDVASDARVLAHCHWQSEPSRHPALLLLHGLEGSCTAHYMGGMAEKA